MCPAAPNTAMLPGTRLCVSIIVVPACQLLKCPELFDFHHPSISL
jgi:hypothetical protein